jgi:hypothetical protein
MPKPVIIQSLIKRINGQLGRWGRHC